MTDQELIKENTRLAFEHHQAGRLEEAETLYKQILIKDPNNANVMNLLGLLTFNSGRENEAVNHLMKAVEIFPCAYFYKNLGIFYITLSEKDRAIECFKKVITYEPDNIDVLIKLADLYREKNAPDNYINCYKKIIEIEPQEVNNYLNIANAYMANNDLYNAVDCYLKAIELNPDLADVYIQLGQILINNGRFDESVSILKKLVKNNAELPGAYYYLGYALFCRYKFNLKNRLKIISAQTFDDFAGPLKNFDELQEIINCFMKTIELDPDQAGVYVDLGNTFCETSQYQNAVNCFKKAIELAPDYVDAYYNLGIAYKAMNSPDSSIEYYKKALALNPDDTEALLNLGSILSHFNKFDEALASYRKILAINPKNTDACVNIGFLYMKMDEYDKSLEYYNKALEMGHNKEELYFYIGSSFANQGKMQEAIEYFNKALEINPNNARVLNNLGKVLLINGDFAKGLELYELRLLESYYLKDNRVYASMPQHNKWRGEPLNGKTLYVYYEQGFGDVIQYARFMPLLNSMGANVIFKVQETFEQFFKQNDLNAEIINDSGPEEQISYDYHIPLMSLPYVLGINMDNIPYSEGYLKADKEKVKFYKEKYFNNDYFKIGIAWQGTPFGLLNRIVPLNNFFKLAGVPNIKIYSLQKGYGIEDQFNNIPENIEIVDLGKTFESFSDTAAAIENLDLAIIADTSVVHMCGALGKPTWLLLPKIPEWRWMLDREDTPWYKSFKLFRQKEAGNWAEVMDRIAVNLNCIVNK